jgi:hypothetical protein
MLAFESEYATDNDMPLAGADALPINQFLTS